MTSSENIKASSVIIVNSLVYFLLAYFFVITLSNVFSILLGKISGFDGTLYYYGFVLHEQSSRWSGGNIFLIYGLGIGITLFTGILSERWYRAICHDHIKAKLFILWVSIISFTWFFGNVIVGSFINFGIGAAMRAVSIPFIVKIIIAIIAVGALTGIGYYLQTHILISSNMYYREFSKSKFKNFLLVQIIIPAIVGITIVMFYKYPHSAEYQYMDLLCLLPVLFLALGSFIERPILPSLGKTRKHNSFQFNKNAFFFLVIIMILYRFGLSHGLKF